jgi:hypothetical protein
MTKVRRVTLLIADILMLLGGIGSVLFFIAITLTLREAPGWPHIPSSDEIRATTETWRLRGMAADAYDKLQIFTEMVDVYRWYFLVFGSLLCLGSLVHFGLTPWRLRETPR